MKRLRQSAAVSRKKAVSRILADFPFLVSFESSFQGASDELSFIKMLLLICFIFI